MTREEAIKAMFYVKNHFWNDTEVNIALDMAIEALQTHPTLDDVSTAYENGYKQGKFEALQSQQKTGKWWRRAWSIECSECGYDMPFAIRNYCPNCGAKMEEEQ